MAQNKYDKIRNRYINIQLAIKLKANEWQNAKEAANIFETKLKNLQKFCNTLLADDILNTEIASVTVALCEEFITRCKVSMMH